MSLLDRRSSFRRRRVEKRQAADGALTPERVGWWSTVLEVHLCCPRMRILVSCDDLVRSHFAAWRHTRAQSVTMGEASQTRNASLSRNPPLKVVLPLLQPSARAVPCEWHMERGREEPVTMAAYPPNGPPPRRHVNASLTILSVNARWIPRACVCLAHARPAGGTASNRAPFFRAPVSAENTIHFCTQRQRVVVGFVFHGRSHEEVKTTPSCFCCCRYPLDIVKGIEEGRVLLVALSLNPA
jgi:hypothetical protein